MTSAPVTVQDLLFIKGNSLVSNCGKNLVHSKPGIAGLVGLGKVAEVGSNVKHVKASDNIIVSQTGAWTSKGKDLYIYNVQANVSLYVCTYVRMIHRILPSR